MSVVGAAVEIVMPRLSDSMEEGTILAWLVEPGQHVSAGDDLLEVETDKATMTYQAEGSGTLEILAEAGSTHPVGTSIARLAAGEAAAPATAPDRDDAPPRQPAATPLAQQPAATPLARRAARIHGVDLAGLGGGSGLGGRIVKADVLTAAGIEEAAPPTPAPEPREPAPAPAQRVEEANGDSTLQEPTRLQAVIARRMAEAKRTVPHFQVATEARMDAAIELRRRLKEIAGEGPVPSVNDMILRASALALRDHPKANASFRDDRFELRHRINVGMAVAADDGLVVPVIHDADRKSLGEIAREARSLAARVRSGEVTPPELAGGTFTVSNLGMFGMTAINPVVNLGQAAILGVGMTRQILQRGAGGEIEDAALMTLTLSCDHRILYGADAARFLAQVRDLLEAPLGLAL